MSSLIQYFPPPHLGLKLHTLCPILFSKIKFQCQLHSVLNPSHFQVINVQVPFLFKLSVDWLSAQTGANSMIEFTDANSTMLALFVSPAAVLIGFGIARAGASACNGTVYEVTSNTHENFLNHS